MNCPPHARALSWHEKPIATDQGCSVLQVAHQTVTVQLLSFACEMTARHSSITVSMGSGCFIVSAPDRRSTSRRRLQGDVADKPIWSTRPYSWPPRQPT